MTHVSKQEQAKPAIATYLTNKNVLNRLESMLKERTSEFTSNLIALADSDKKLQECEPQKLMQCAMNATALKLSLNKSLGHAYIIPYKGVPQFQIGYKGLIQLAIRSGQYKTLNAAPVREGEIEYNVITGVAKFIGENPEGEVVGYISHSELISGFEKSIYMTCEQIEAFALKYSQAYANDKRYNKRTSKWSDPDSREAMAKKTVLKRLLSTYGLLSVDLQKAMSSDVEVEESPIVSNNPRNIEAEVIPQQGEQEEESDTVEI